MAYVFLSIKNIGWFMKLAALVSGGKDSLYALKKASEKHKIEYIICVKAEDDSELLHSENLDLVKLQSESLGIPLVWREGSGEGVKPLEEAVEAVEGEIDGVVSGVIASNYQRERVEGICEKFGLENLTPLWEMNGEKLMEDLLDNGFEVIITKVAAQGLDQSWLGKTIDKDVLEKLRNLREKYNVHIAGEGGEFETLVVDCPLFKKGIELGRTRQKWEKKTKTGYLEIFSSRLR